jgi:murein L,D-transpeptidase YcbB/YkuD
LPATFLLLLLMLATPLGHSVQSPSADCGSALCGFVASGSLPGLQWPDFSDYRTQVQNFYEPTTYAYAWIYRGEAIEQAKAIIERLKDADAKGLNSEDYDGPRWADRLAALSQAGNARSESDLATFDLALTVSVMRYVSDLHFGKVNPGLFHAASDLGNEQNDLAHFIRQRLVNATDVSAVLDGIEPTYQGYRRTQQALRGYLAMAREMAREDDPGPFPLTKKPVEPGARYPAAAQLAAVLRRLGDLPADVTPFRDSNLYDRPLVDAVKHFQMRHGLDPDGRIGKATLAQLNTPLSDRIRQLQLTLERWRWAPRSFSRPPIVVNIPEFKLRAVDRAYQPELEMKVVVGKAFGHQTPVFAADMKYVVFRPYWNVPFSIQRAELVPKLDRDRSYLVKNQFEVVAAQDEVVSHGVVDDKLLKRLRSGELRIRQIPGPENSLGLVAFMFPNKYDVYLHATPATVLFSQSRRDFSHGCLRAEKPEQLAAWILRDKPEWTPERILDAMNGTETIRVNLDRPIPVLVVYATAVVLVNGEVRFFEDIYGQDAQLEQLLAKGYPYWR